MPRAKAAEQQPAEDKRDLVEMVRDADAYPQPHTADVHPAEVENFKAGGWVLKE